MQGMLDALNDPQMRHAALVHLPIGLTVAAVLLTLAAALAGGRGHTLRATAIVAWVLVAITAAIAVNSGEAAHDAIDRLLPGPVQEVLDDHELRAERVWLLALVPMVFLVVSMLERSLFRHGGAWVAVVAGLGVNTWIAYTGHLGGELVYAHAVGQDGGGSGGAAMVETAQDPRAVFFSREVYPILEANCLRCHNPQRMRRSGDLDQTTISGMLEGGLSGPAIVPGRPEESLLIKAVTHAIEDLEMPPGDNEPLSSESIEKLRQWIDDGAVWVAIPRAEPPDEPAGPDRSAD